MKIYQTGGSVRDELLGKPIGDVDYTLENVLWEEAIDYLKKDHVIVAQFPRYGSIKVYKKTDATHAHIDYSLCRLDLPNSYQSCTIKQDLSRRDFTMNAIARDMDTGKYIDPCDGIADIHSNMIRLIGPISRFYEDPRRIIRAIRFAITKSMFLEDRLHKALSTQECCDSLAKINPHALALEVNKCLIFDQLKTIAFLEQYLGIRRIIFHLLRLRASVRLPNENKRESDEILQL